MALLLIIIAPNRHILANIAMVSQFSLAIDLSSKGLPGQLRSSCKARRSWRTLCTATWSLGQRRDGFLLTDFLVAHHIKMSTRCPPPPEPRKSLVGFRRRPCA